VKPEEARGLYLRGTIGGRSYSVLVMEVRVYQMREKPEAEPVEMWSLMFEGVAQGWRLGPWLVDVEASKATPDTIRMAVEATIKRMMGW
jgi:hypothetical protein